MIEVYKVNITTEQTNGSNTTTKYFMTLEKASEYLEEQRQYYFEDCDESDDSDSETGGEETKEELKENNDISDDTEDYVEEITVEFLSSLFEENTEKFIPSIVFEYFGEDEYTSVTINKISIDN
jgi:hypothetical protein